MSKDYSRLEKLLFRGFLTTEVIIGDLPIVLKSLNSREQELIELQSFSEDKNWKSQASFQLAYSTLFFNQENVLTRRDELLTQLAGYYAEIPEPALIDLLKASARLTSYSAKELHNVEPYAYGVKSRQAWNMYKDISLCDPRCTGFPGTENLGLNTHQVLWNYFNQMEDKEDDHLQQYQLAKFMVSPHAPDEVKRLDQSDSKDRRQRQKRRKALHEGRDPSMVEENNEIRITNETADELRDQMERANRGEKDYHDLIIEQHQQRIRDAYQRRKQREEERRRRAMEERRNSYREAASLAQEGYSPEEVAHYLEMADKRRQGQRGQSQDEVDSVPIEQREASLLRSHFIDIEDIPEERRHNYIQEDNHSRSVENPLIQEHYERVSEDLNQRRSVPRGPREKNEDGENH